MIKVSGSLEDGKSSIEHHSINSKPKEKGYTSLESANRAL